MQQEKDIFKIIREKHGLKEYCESCGVSFVKIGRSYRDNSPFTGANNAFRIDIDEPDFWTDYSLDRDNNGGDIIKFSAMLKHNGDIRAALLELAPEGYSAKIDKYFKDKQSAQDFIIGAHNNIPEYIIKYYESRGVDLEQINRLKLGYRNENVILHWLVIPRVDFNGDFRYYRLRRAPNEQGKEDEQHQPEKYKCAYIGNNSFLKNIPLGLQTLNQEIKYFYLVICEGDFDYLNFEREGFAVIGTGGGGGINKEILKIIRDNAEKFTCGVLLAFDNDEAGKKFTLDGANLLFKYKIKLSVVILPDNCKDINDYYRSGGSLQKLAEDAMPGLEYIALNLVPNEDFNTLSRGRQQTLKKNIKDFFIECRRDGADNADIQTLCECLIKRGLPEKWIAEIKAKSENGDSEYEISQHLQEKHNLLYNEKTGFFEYDTELNTWRQSDDTTIGSYVYDYLGHEAKSRKINSAVDITKKAVNSNIPVDMFNRKPLIPLRNCTLHIDFKTATVNPLSITPSDYVTSRAIYDYVPYAKCDEWLNTLQVIFAGDERRINCFQEFCGYVWLPDTRFQKSLYMRGNGSNGKSLLINVLTEVYGKENISTLQLADLLQPFQRINLLYSRVNVGSDEKEDIRGAESMIKKAITGDMINGCFKQKDFINFKPHAKFIFACNEPLKVSSKNYAIIRRFLLIDCPVKFVDYEPNINNPFECKKDFGLEARLMTPESLSGIFWWTLNGLSKLLKNGGIFTTTAEQAEISNAFVSKTDSIDDFVKECNSEWRGQKITRDEIYIKYLEYCDNARIQNTVRAEDNFFSLFNIALTNHKVKAKTNGQRHDGKRYYEFYTSQEIQENQ